jgi:hypothetical protein
MLKRHGTGEREGEVGADFSSPLCQEVSLQNCQAQENNGFGVNRRTHGMSLQLVIKPCPTRCGSLACQSLQSVPHAAPRDEF